MTVTARVLCVIALSKVAVTLVFVATPVAESAGVLALTVTGAVSAVVKDQILGSAMSTSSTLLAVREAGKGVPPANGLVGVKVARRVPES